MYMYTDELLLVYRIIILNIYYECVWGLLCNLWFNTYILSEIVCTFCKNIKWIIHVLSKYNFVASYQLIVHCFSHWWREFGSEENTRLLASNSRTTSFIRNSLLWPCYMDSSRFENCQDIERWHMGSKHFNNVSFYFSKFKNDQLMTYTWYMYMW